MRLISQENYYSLRKCWCVDFQFWYKYIVLTAHLLFMSTKTWKKMSQRQEKTTKYTYLLYFVMYQKFWSKMFMKTFLKWLYSIYKGIPICRFLIRLKPSKNSRLYSLLLLLNHSILFFLGSSQKSASFRTAQAKQTFLLS